MESQDLNALRACLDPSAVVRELCLEVHKRVKLGQVGLSNLNSSPRLAPERPPATDAMVSVSPPMAMAMAMETVSVNESTLARKAASAAGTVSTASMLLLM